MPKKNIHPECFDVDVVLSNGKHIKVKSTMKRENKTMKLDVDPTNHPAWRKDSGTFVNANNDQVSKFKKKYGSMFS